MDFYLYKNRTKFCPFVQHPWFYWIMREIFVQLSSKFCPLLIILSTTPDFTGFYTRYFLIFSWPYHNISSKMLQFWPPILSTNPVKSGAVDKILTVCPFCPDLGHFHPFSCPILSNHGIGLEFDEKIRVTLSNCRTDAQSFVQFVQLQGNLSNHLSSLSNHPLTIQNSRKKVLTCTTKLPYSNN